MKIHFRSYINDLQTLICNHEMLCFPKMHFYIIKTINQTNE